MTRRLARAIAILAAGVAAPALAQSASDVVVMRRVIEKPVESRGWFVGEWAWADEAICSTSALQTRDVHCTGNGGTTVDDASCKSAKPATERRIARTEGCRTDWVSTDWSAWSSTCSAHSTRSRSVECRSEDGKGGTMSAPDSACPSATRPASADMQAITTGCTFDWNIGSWSPYSTTCGAANRNRTVECRATNGDAPGSAVADGSCAAPVPPRNEATQVTTGCTFQWDPGVWTQPSTTCGTSTETRTVTCRATNGDSSGQSVDAAKCDPSDKPEATRQTEQTSGCSYKWTSGAWSPLNQCSDASVQNRTVVCTKTDTAGNSTTVPDASCTAVGNKPNTTQTIVDYSSCSYAWTTGTYGAWASTCSTSTTHTRTVACTRSGGTSVAATVDDTMCPAPVPARTESGSNLAGCTYAWTATAYSAWDNSCSSNASRTVTWTCQRSDGTPVTANPTSVCGTKPSVTQTGVTATGCGTAFANASFEAQDTSWGTSDFVRSNVVAHTGTYSAQIGGYGGAQPSQTAVSSKGMTNYKLSFWAYQKPGGTRSLTINYNGFTTGSGTPNYTFNNIGAGWTQFSITFAPQTSATTSALYVKFFKSLNNDPDTFVDDVTLELAN